jgi:hypothetical protein
MAAFLEEVTLKRSIIVCLEKEYRREGAIEVMPAEMFFKELWNGKIF